VVKLEEHLATIHAVFNSTNPKDLPRRTRSLFVRWLFCLSGFQGGVELESLRAAYLKLTVDPALVRFPFGAIVAIVSYCLSHMIASEGCCLR